MIQFNLLPDVKLQYLKARYRKRLVIGISTIISAVCLVIFVVLIVFVRVGQKQQLDSVSKKIKESQTTLEKNTDLNKILTIQNQLASLPKLHDDKVISSRLFDYLIQLTPNAATISNVDVDFAKHTITIKGNADVLGTVNKFADTLKFTTFKAPATAPNEKPQEGKAFSNVVLESFAVANPKTAGTKTDNRASYEISASFDAVIFANIKADASSSVKEVVLVVPQIITTRSETQKPMNLFEQQPAVIPGQEGDR